jgi:hypothetical protein
MRVFVSSTMRDLSSYRDIIRMALLKSGHTFLGMEQFAAQNSPPLAVCLRELETAEVYIGLIGDIYGSIPQGEQQSYTELDYRRARAISLDCVILVISDNAFVQVGARDHDVARHALLTQFREELMRNHTVDRFSDPNEAAWQILAALRVVEMRVRERPPRGEGK